MLLFPPLTWPGDNIGTAWCIMGGNSNMCVLLGADNAEDDILDRNSIISLTNIVRDWICN